MPYAMWGLTPTFPTKGSDPIGFLRYMGPDPISPLALYGARPHKPPIPVWAYPLDAPPNPNTYSPFTITYSLLWGQTPPQL